MIRDIVIDIIESTWPIVFICSVIVITIKAYDILVNKKEFIFYKEFIILTFIIYCICLFQIVTFQDVSWSTNNFVLFKEITRYDFGSSSFIRNVLGNVLLFVPLGFYYSYFLKIKNYIYILLMVLLSSLTIETTQLLIGRVFDIDDILLNVIGGTIGYLSYLVLDKLFFLKKRYICNIITIVLIVLIAIYLGGIYV